MCRLTQEHKSLAFVDMVTALETKKAKIIMGADGNSDHYMVKTRIRLCLNAFKIKSKLRPRLDVECLKNMVFIKKYNDCLRKKLSKIKFKKRRMRI